jgi:peroxiredoxin
MGFQLFGISPDRPAKIRETLERHKLRFHLLSDSQMVGANAFRIAYRLDDGTLKQLAGSNIDIEEASGEKHHMLPVPAVFLVETNGLVQFEYVNPDYRVRINPDLLMAAARVSRG